MAKAGGAVNRFANKLVIGICALVAFVLIATGVMMAQPPDLLRVGANYTATIVCANVFLAGRDPQTVLAEDVQAPGHPLLRLARIEVDREHALVRAALLGLIGDGLAVYRAGTGCAAVPDEGIEGAERIHFDPPTGAPPPDNLPWPVGGGAQIDARMQAVVDNDSLAGPGVRAVLVVHDGKLIAERYSDGFRRDMRLTGWSMTKTVTAALIGIEVADGRLRLDQDKLLPAAVPSDGREKITIADLLAMSSGLHFNEDYGAVSDVTRMLYLEPDMVRFARDQKMDFAPGTHWSYSSGTAVLVSDIWQRAADTAALGFPYERLFQPLGMTSAILEADARGHYVGSSYLYATAQDWARFGQFLVQDGVWNGKRMLPEGYVEMMRAPVPDSKGAYGKGMVWLDSPDESFRQAQQTENGADRFWLRGHDGQYEAVVPSRKLVVVRLGLTPGRLGYTPLPLLRAVYAVLDLPEVPAR
jgi:CubicO group peptidase (beta-lactamase class C family)